MDFIIQMLDLFYANKWLYKKLKKRDERLLKKSRFFEQEQQKHKSKHKNITKT